MLVSWGVQKSRITADGWNIKSAIQPLSTLINLAFLWKHFSMEDLNHDNNLSENFGKEFCQEIFN
jgi:hypothetical protein